MNGAADEQNEEGDIDSCPPGYTKARHPNGNTDVSCEAAAKDCYGALMYTPLPERAVREGEAGVGCWRGGQFYCTPPEGRLCAGPGSFGVKFCCNRPFQLPLTDPYYWCRRANTG